MPTAFRRIALASCLTALAACQSYQSATPERTAAPSTPMDGKWASADGVFVATFQGGSFTSVDARTNAILAQGSYSAAGTVVTMNWRSAATDQQHSATCTLSDPNNVRCNQANATGFDLKRTG